MMDGINNTERQVIDKAATDVALQIWAHPETGFNEVFASKYICEVLESFGFAIERPYAGVQTAFRAVWGEGKPVIGLLAEYDALPEMSQKVSTTPEPIVQKGPGHGCGHNLAAGCAVAAALEMQSRLRTQGLSGTVVVYGCPGEELLTGKPFMARGGAFRDLDIAFSGHGAGVNIINAGIQYAALDNVEFHFTGKAAHAAVSPWSGRSALDAVELMNVGVNYLREHIPPSVRMHYTITNGGSAPNTVPDSASVWYYIRAFSREEVNDALARIKDVAEGAAMMTETSVSLDYKGGCYGTEFSQVMGDLIDEVRKATPLPEWTEEEIAFAAALNQQNPNCKPDTPPLATKLFPMGKAQVYGSADSGDVSRLVPTCSFTITCSNSLAPSHSWQVTACAGHSIGIKGMLCRAKIIAEVSMRMFQDPAIVAKAWDELRAKNLPPYRCPIPDDVLPPAPQLAE